MKASIIIITKDQKDLLQRSLPVLLNQDFEGGYEIIVVDSCSTDGAREYPQSLPVKPIKIQPETFNFAKAFNTGVGGTYGIYTITGRGGYGYPDFWPAERFPQKLTKYSVEPTPLAGVNLFGIEFGDDGAREKVFNFAVGEE